MSFKIELKKPSMEIKMQIKSNFRGILNALFWVFKVWVEDLRLKGLKFVCFLSTILRHP